MSHPRLVQGHAPSPYLRRYRIPQLNTIRPHDDPCSPEDEPGKMELIRQKMEELTKEAIAKRKRIEAADRLQEHSISSARKPGSAADHQSLAPCQQNKLPDTLLSRRWMQMQSTQRKPAVTPNGDPVSKLTKQPVPSRNIVGHQA